MTSYARAERAALADLLLQVGPDAPTIDEGWLTRDLAAHLVLRERRPDAALGIVVPPLAGHTQRVQDAIGRQPWPDVVARVRQPPRFAPVAVPAVDDAVNTTEYTIHHEDVRRAQPGWEPRVLAPERQDALWRGVGRVARLAYRRSPVGVRLVRTGTGEEVVAKPGEPAVTLIGEPLELLLHSSGRGAYARVEEQGDAAALAALRGTKLGV